MRAMIGRIEEFTTWTGLQFDVAKYAQAFPRGIAMAKGWSSPPNFGSRVGSSL